MHTNPRMHEKPFKHTDAHRSQSEQSSEKILNENNDWLLESNSSGKLLLIGPTQKNVI